MKNVCTYNLFAIIFLIDVITISPLRGQHKIITFSDDLIGENFGNFILNATKDDLGFVWLGTMDGIVRWDGMEAHFYKYNPEDSASFPALAAQSQNLFWNKAEQTLWVPTDTALAIYDPATDRFTNYFHEPENPQSLPSGDTEEVLQDKEGNIWIATGDGLALFTGNKENRTFTSIREDRSGKYRFGEIYDIEPSRFNDSIMWLGTRFNGLFRFNKHTFEVINYNEDNSGIDNYVSRIYEDKEGHLYLSRYKKITILFHFDPYNRKVTKPSLADVYQLAYYTNVFGGNVKEKRLWTSLPKGEGVFLLDDYNHKFIPVKKILGGGGSIVDALVVLKEEHTLWFGTTIGMLKEKVAPNYIENYFFKIPDDRRKRNTYIWPFCALYYHEATNNLVLPQMEYNNLILFHLDSKKISFVPFPYNPGKKDITVKSIIGIDEYSVFLNINNEPFTLNLVSGKVTPIRFKQQVKINRMIKDLSGQIWIIAGNEGSHSYELYKYDIKTNQLTKIENKVLHTIGADLRKMFVDRNNNIWMDFTEDHLVGYIQRENRFKYLRGKENGNFRPSGFAQDSSGKLYLLNYHTSGSHISTIDPVDTDKGFQDVDWLKDILISKIRNDMVMDHSGRLWIIGRYGLEVLDLNTRTVKLFNHAHGLSMWNDFLNRSPVGDAFLSNIGDNKIGITYRGGFGIFHPDSLLKVHEKYLDTPIPYLTAFRVKGEPFQSDSSVLLKNNYVLDFEQNDIAINYSVIDHSDFNQSEISHRMVGVQNNWITSKERFATYSNLTPGKYEFKIRVKRKISNVEDQIFERSYHIEILPPWYRTWWAYILWSGLFFGSIYSIYHFQLNRRLAESEARRLKELDQAKSQLYTNITHEFRTPLTVILGMADQMKTDPKSWFNEGLRLIYRNGRQLLNLVNQMLDLSKLESGQMRLNLIQGDIVGFIHYLSESFHSYADSKDIRLHFSSDFKEIMMDYDPEKVQHILANLLSNAIKFTPAGGDVYIQLLSGFTNLKVGNKKITVQRTKTAKSEEHLLLVVKDNGQGIAPEHLPYIFDRFYQGDAGTTRKGEGTGIGLALTKELVHLMDGEIEVESETARNTNNTGTKFTIILPITKHAAIVSTPAKDAISLPETLATELPGKTLSGPEDVLHSNLPLVLLIEDNIDVITYLTSFLRHDYQLETALNGKEGIDKALELTPDLIVCDVMMPEKDGFEVCQTLKTDERTSHIPIILLTAKSDPAARLEGLIHGADAYLAKPFNKEELLVRMEKLIELRRRLQAHYAKTSDLLKIAKKPKPATEDLFLQKLLAIVEENLSDEHFGLPDLCRKANLSRSQLFRKLKALTGQSATHFIRSIRLEKGKELLETTDKTVSEVAFAVGFNNLPYFSKMFKEMYGIPPGEVRK